MKRTALAIVVSLAALVGSRPLAAQSAVVFEPTPDQVNAQCDFRPTAPNAPIMFTCVDWIDVASGTIAGWSVNLNTRRSPSSYTLARFADGVASFVATTNFPVARPDVAAWLGTDQSVGVGIVAGPLAPGDYTLLVTDLPYSAACGVYPIGYPNAGQMWCDYVPNAIRFRVQ